MQYDQTKEFTSGLGEFRMRQVTSQEIKEISFHILEDVAEFCDAHSIRYFLVCGTALGAVRHNGFIPWDDDVDIGMPRPDYIRFLLNYQSDNYVLCSSDRDKKYPYPFSKVCDFRTELIENISHPCRLGVYIDVFPIDGLPQEEITCRRHLRQIEWMQKLLTWKRIPLRKEKKLHYLVLHFATKCVLSLFPISFLVNRLERSLCKYPYASSEFVGHFVTKSYWGNDIKPRYLFDNPIRHKFESTELWLPGGFDEYLRLEYGDYLKLPPVEKRVSNHDFVAYWKE